MSLRASTSQTIGPYLRIGLEWMQNDFDKALKRIDNETSDYYVLGYYSSNPDPLRRTRKVEIKTTRPSLNVWSRGEYTLRPMPAADQR